LAVVVLLAALRVALRVSCAASSPASMIGLAGQRGAGLGDVGRDVTREALGAPRGRFGADPTQQVLAGLVELVDNRVDLLVRGR
jgi:hypothetical protein